MKKHVIRIVAFICVAMLSVVLFSGCENGESGISGNGNRKYTVSSDELLDALREYIPDSLSITVDEEPLTFDLYEYELSFSGDKDSSGKITGECTILYRNGFEERHGVRGVTATCMVEAHEEHNVFVVDSGGDLVTEVRPGSDTGSDYIAGQAEQLLLDKYPYEKEGGFGHDSIGMTLQDDGSLLISLDVIGWADVTGPDSHFGQGDFCVTFQIEKIGESSFEWKCIAVEDTVELVDRDTWLAQFD